MAHYIIGIDEVGRGSIAGPVTVTALAVPHNFKFKSTSSKIKLRDSKKLSSAQRDVWLAHIKNNKQILYSTAHIQASVIDKINISNAANKAATKAFLNLILRNQIKPTNKTKVYLDGGLFIKDNLLIKKYKPKTVIKGDEKIKVVSLASIVAKVTRDSLMIRMHKKYPKYRFDINKGYGTKMHMDAVKKNGPSEKHRKTFI